MSVVQGSWYEINGHRVIFSPGVSNNQRKTATMDAVGPNRVFVVEGVLRNRILYPTKAEPSKGVGTVT